jgi:uncharacterized protein
MNAARACFLALLLCFSFAARAEVAVPPLTGRVVDQTGTLSSGDIASLQQTLRAFESRKGSQIAVLIVSTTDGEAIEPFSLRVAEAWKIGRKKIDDGALLVVARNDRKLRIEVGYGLEGALTDVTAKRIIDEDITPKFKSGDFAGGVSAGIDRMIKVIDGEKLPEPEPPHWNGSGFENLIDPSNPLVIVGVVVLGGIMRSVLGRLIGATVTGGVVGLVAWFIAGSLGLALLAAGIVFLITLIVDAPTTSGGSGGWSGGSSSSGSSGWSSSSSSDSGGGGGSFGGGGASGSW